MSVDIAAALRREAKTAQAVAERQTNRQDKTVLQQLAAKLVEIAEDWSATLGTRGNRNAAALVIW